MIRMFINQRWIQQPVSNDIKEILTAKSMHFRRRQAEAQSISFIPKRPAVDRRDTVLCIDGAPTGDGCYEEDEDGFDAT